MKRLAAIVFAALLLSFMVCGCKKTETDPSGRVPRTDGGQSGVPADFWYGKELCICTASDSAAAQDLFAQENDAMQGEPIYDAVRKREKILRTEYGITTALVEKNTATQSAYAYLSRGIKAGDAAFDCLVTDGTTAYALAQQGMLCDFSEIDSLDLERDFWESAVQRQLTLGGAVYFLTGDFTSYDDRATQLIAFSKELWSQYADLLGCDTPYTLVESGDWTLPAMLSAAELVASQRHATDADGARYGCAVTDASLSGFLLGADVHIVSANAAGEQSLCFPGARTDTAWNQLMQFFTSGAVVNRSAVSDFKMDAFQNGRTLFYTDTIGGIIAMRALRSDFSFGILPYPKLDSAQSGYFAASDSSEAVFLCMPLSCADSEKVGQALSVFAYVSSQTLTPAFYEKVLYGASVRDEESEPMLRLILANKQYDLGLWRNFGGFSDALRSAAKEKKENISAVYRSMQSQIERDFSQDMKYFE